MSFAVNIADFGKNLMFSGVYEYFFKGEVANLKKSTHGDIIYYEFISTANPSTLLVVDKYLFMNKGKITVHKDSTNNKMKAYMRALNELFALGFGYVALAQVSD